MIPQHNISGQSVNPEQIVDIIPEQEKADRQIQQNEEKYFQQLKAEGEDKLRNDAKMWEGLSTLSSSIGDIIKKKQEKHREDREAEISLEILRKPIKIKKSNCAICINLQFATSYFQVYAFCDLQYHNLQL